MLRSCAECGIAAPEMPIDHASTLLSLKYGWRLRRRTDENGVRRVLAQCPECSAKARGVDPGKTNAPARAVAFADDDSVSLPAAAEFGEVLLPYRDGKGREEAALSTKMRSTWLLQSQGLLRRHGLYAQYLRAIPDSEREALKNIGPSGFCPIEQAVVHYTACEKLGLPDDEVTTLSAETGVQVRASIVQVRAAGRGEDDDAVAWSVLESLHAVLLRSMDGGGGAVYRLGPSLARVEVGRVKLAAIRYFRLAVRGLLHGMMAHSTPDARVFELESLCTSETLAYRLVWGDSSRAPLPSV